MNMKVQLITVLALLVSILSGELAVSAERIVIGTPSRGLFEFPAVVAMRRDTTKTKGWMSIKFRCSRRSLSRR